MAVKVLEERLGVQTVLTDHLGETLANVAHNSFFFSGCLTAAVVCAGAGVINASVDVLFELFLGEYFLNMVTEVLPSDVFTFFRCFEMLGQQFEFIV